MVFELPWFTDALFGVRIAAGTGIANLRLHKLFRVMARIGRLLRIIKTLLVGRFRSFFSHLFKTRPDFGQELKTRLARQHMSVSAKGQIWHSLEALTTFGVMTVFAVIYILATVYLGTFDRDRAARDALQIVLDLDEKQVEAVLPFYIERFPEVLYLRVDRRIVKHDSLSLDALRDKEIEKHIWPEAELWLDAGNFVKGQARRYTWLTTVLIVAISAIVIFINWAVTRFAFSISGALKTLAQALDERDSYTRMHSQNVAELAEKTARVLGMGRERRRIIRIAGELHDIGKIGIPEAILHKSGRLSAGEYDRMKMHPSQGANILEPLTIFESVLVAVLHHHERYDGSGYPNGLQGESIPRLAQILAVCDVWDALTTDRPYRPAVSPDEAKKIIEEGKGSLFDPKVVKAFMHVVESISDSGADPSG